MTCTRTRKVEKKSQGLRVVSSGEGTGLPKDATFRQILEHEQKKGGPKSTKKKGSLSWEGGG
ncbi:MAG: hypothetical protein WD509_02140 [Candidatus Paceibacterota bacterium]